MIHEFAVEPELAATWGRNAEYRHFVAAFGLGTARVVSGYPRDWTNLVLKSALPATEMEGKRLEVLLTQVSRVLVRRSGPYDARQTWMRNALAEHARTSFSGILARSDSEDVAVITEAIMDHSPVWNRPLGLACSRSSASVAAVMAPLLRCCQRVAFVDPHFGPENAKHRRPLQALLRALVTGRPGNPPEEVAVITSVKSTHEFFVAHCGTELPRLTPRGLKLVLRRLKSRTGGEKLHNRYILTDLGGVSFGIGLDEGDPTHKDDLHVLSEGQLALRQKQYLGAELAFEKPEEDVVVVGLA